MSAATADARVFCTETAPEWVVPAGWLIGARTRTVDSWTPIPELIRMPPIRVPPAQLRFSIREGETHRTADGGDAHRIKGMLTRLIPRREARAGLLFDLRFDGCQNFAHATILSAPLAAAVREVARVHLGRSDVVLVVPKEISSFVARALEPLGIPLFQASGPVDGTIVEAEICGHVPEIRLAPRFLPESLAATLGAGSPASGPRLFISRRKSRYLVNEADVASLLEARGYRKVYLEDHPVLDQLKMVFQATEIVAIHGAALGPLLWRACEARPRPLRLVELFGAGYVVTLYREIAALLGARWVGVRGRLSAQVVEDLDVRGLPRSHESSPIDVDLDALRLALETVEQGAPEPPFEMQL